MGIGRVDIPVAFLLHHGASTTSRRPAGEGCLQAQVGGGGGAAAAAAAAAAGCCRAAAGSAVWVDALQGSLKPGGWSWGLESRAAAVRAAAARPEAPQVVGYLPTPSGCCHSCGCAPPGRRDAPSGLEESGRPPPQAFCSAGPLKREHKAAGRSRAQALPACHSRRGGQPSGRRRDGGAVAWGQHTTDGHGLAACLVHLGAMCQQVCAASLLT